MKVLKYIIKISSIIFISIILFSCAFAYNRSGTQINLNRDIGIKVISGNVSLKISGHISDDIYYEDKNNPIVTQGKETINKNLILYENNEFKYTLTGTEVVILIIKSIDENDAKILVYEYGKSKEYIIDGKNKVGKMISFKNY